MQAGDAIKIACAERNRELNVLGRGQRNHECSGKQRMCGAGARGSA